MSVKGVIGGVVGGVAGFIVGGPAGAVIGFGLGMGLGMMMDPLEPDVADTPGQGQIQKMDIPTAAFGDPLPDFVGTVKLAGNIIQSWGHRVVEVTEQQSTPGGKAGGGTQEQTVVVGYKHHLSWLHAFAYGPDPVDTVWAVLFDEKVVWYGELTDDDEDGEETVQLGDASGENLGSMTFYFGTSNQVPNSKAAAALDDPNLGSAYRGACYVLFDDIMIGGYARLPSIKIVMSKWPAIPTLGDSSLAIVNTLDYNPAFAIWYISENHTEIPTSFLNSASFTSSATYFVGVDNPAVGVSLVLNRQVVSETYIEAIMNHVGASLVEIDGELNLGVLRDEVSESDMESIDDTMVLEIPSLTVGSWEDTYNDLKVLYSKINHIATVYEEDCGTIAGSETDEEELGFQYTYNASGVHCIGDIYCTLYIGSLTSNYDRVLQTFSIPDTGVISPEIDTYNHNIISFTSGSANLIKVYDGSTYVILAHIRSLNQTTTYISTYKVDSTGNISFCDDQAFPGYGVHYDGSVNVMALVGSTVVVGTGTYIFTILIDSSGNINPTVQDSVNEGQSDIYGDYGYTEGVIITQRYLTGTFHICSYMVTGTSITVLDDFDTTRTSKADHILGRCHNTWQGIVFTQRTDDSQYDRAVYSLGCNAGWFSAAITDMQLIQSREGDHWPEGMLMEWMSGGGIFLHWVVNGLDQHSSYITSIVIRYNGMLGDDYPETKQTKPVLVTAGAKPCARMSPIQINEDTGEYLLQWSLDTGVGGGPYIQTWNVSSKCRGY